MLLHRASAPGASSSFPKFEEPADRAGGGLTATLRSLVRFQGALAPTRYPATMLAYIWPHRRASPTSLPLVVRTRPRRSLPGCLARVEPRRCGARSFRHSRTAVRARRHQPSTRVLPRDGLRELLGDIIGLRGVHRCGPELSFQDRCPLLSLLRGSSAMWWREPLRVRARQVIGYRERRATRASHWAVGSLRIST
ncbi:hypothetical protein OF83DRAFT_295467 [Amylostereum chailletii]|nr:hypothetical protein OF83DRAFT_295467 [Amylostereum chailletii]